LTRFAVYDRFGNYKHDLVNVVQCKRTRKTDGTNTLSITCLNTVDKDDRIVFKDPEGKYREYIVTQPSVERAGTIPVSSFNAVDSIKELDLKYVDDKRINNGTFTEAVTKAIEGTRWELGTIASGTVQTNYYHVSALNALQTFLKAAGVEFETEVKPSVDMTHIEHRLINVGRLGSDSSKRFEYGSDLQSIKRTVSADNVYTRLYGYGKGLATTDDEGNATGGYGRKIDFASVNNGKKYVEDSTALQQWGVVGPDGTKVHAEGTVEFPDCEDPSELLALTKAALKESVVPKVSYTADVAALQLANFDIQQLHLGDGVQIVDTTFNPTLRLSGRVLAIEDDPTGDITSMKITLGNIVQSYTQRNNELNSTVSQLWSSSGVVNDVVNAKPGYMQQVVDGLNQVLNATGGWTYMTPGEGIIVYNKPIEQNPDKAIQLGGGYFRIANSKKADGSWDWKTFGTGDGFLADLIVAGKLQSADGKSYWDLSNNMLHMLGQFQTVSTDGHSEASFYPDFDWTSNTGDSADGSGIRFFDRNRGSVADHGGYVSYIGWDRNNDKPLHAMRLGTDVFQDKSAGLGLGSGSLSSQSGTPNVATMWVSDKTKNPNSFGIELNSDTQNVYIGGKLGYWTNLGTFQFFYWEGVSIPAFKWMEFNVTAQPAKSGRYKPLATLDHIASDGNLFFDTTVSSASAGGWKVWVNSAPRTVQISPTTAQWKVSTINGVPNVVSDLNVRYGNSARMFSDGNVNFYLNTLGVLL
jgi:phage minor structural protein